MISPTDTALVSIADMYLFYNVKDHAFSHTLSDPRAHVVSGEALAEKWSPRDLDINEAWRNAKGIGLFSLSGLHFARKGISFNYYDVGANVGMTTIAEAIFLQRCGLSSKVFAFEPGPVYDLLAKAVEVNRLSEVIRPMRVAAADTTGKLTFHVTPAQSPASSLVQAAVSRAEVERSETITVDAIKLDDLIFQQPQTGALIKIDAEGADFKVLAGLSKTMAKKPCVIQIEFFPGIVESYLADSAGALLEISKSFEIWEVEGNTIKSINPTMLGFAELVSRTRKHAMPATDLMFFPKSLPGLKDLLARMIYN